MNTQKALSIEIEKRMVADPEFEKQLIRDIEKFLSGNQKERSAPIQQLDREFINVAHQTKGPNDITGEVLFWGVRFRIPSEALRSIGAAIETGNAISGFSAILGPASPYVTIAMAFIKLNYAWAQSLDRGNGIYLNMTWFAAGIFVPTAI